MSGRIPPHSPEAERAALGAIILDAGNTLPLAIVNTGLTPESFYEPDHAALYAAALKLYEARNPIDILTLSQQFTEEPRIQALIEHCADECLTVAHAEYYLNLVRQKWLARRAITAAQQIQDSAYDTEDADALIASTNSIFNGIVTQRAIEPTNTDRVEASVARWEEAHRRRTAGERDVLAGLPTPWAIMNALTSGLQPGLNILAGRPSAGKSTMEDHLAVHLATLGHPVGRICIDMAADKVLERTCCRWAGVSMPKLEQGFARRDELARIKEAGDRLKKLPIHLNSRDRDVRTICAWARAQHQRHGIKLLTVDFIQLCTYANPGRYMDRNTEIGYISAALKALSFELNIPVLALSQMSRGSEKDSRIPRLSDLRDSGALEQDASTVFFAYKDPDVPEALDATGKPMHRNVWIDLQKHQNGRIGALAFKLFAHYFKFDPAPGGFGGDQQPFNEETT